MTFAYPLTGFATLFILLVYMGTIMKCGAARGKFGVQAPATIGNIEFEKAFRVQMNTLETLPLQLPAMWLLALTAADRWAALAGLVFGLSRIIYALGYYKAPEKRGAGAGIGFLTQFVTVIAALACLARQYFQI